MKHALAFLPLVCLVAACDTDTSACGEGSGRLAAHTVVISKLRFSTPVDGTTEGFDLDDRVSDMSDDRSCNRRKKRHSGISRNLPRRQSSPSSPKSPEEYEGMSPVVARASLRITPRIALTQLPASRT